MKKHATPALREEVVLLPTPQQLFGGVSGIVTQNGCKCPSEGILIICYIKQRVMGLKWGSTFPTLSLVTIQSHLQGFYTGEQLVTGKGPCFQLERVQQHHGLLTLLPASAGHGAPSCCCKAFPGLCCGVHLGVTVSEL